MSEQENMIEIDSDIPLPFPRTGRPRKYPWLELEVGESFLCHDLNAESVGPQGTRYCERKGLDRHFVQRVQEDGKLRVWRDK